MPASAMGLTSTGRGRGGGPGRGRGGGTATEHAKTRTPGCGVVLQSNPESMQAMEAAQLILHRYASIFPNASMNSKAPRSASTPPQMMRASALGRADHDTADSENLLMFQINLISQSYWVEDALIIVKDAQGLEWIGAITLKWIGLLARTLHCYRARWFFCF